jgi:hypothetical protein
MKIYVASSWRNPWQPGVVRALRSERYEVYDFKNPTPGEHGFGWSEIDKGWRDWSPEAYRKALEDPIAEHGFKRDYDAMRWADACLLVLPCGRSAHLEAGWFMGHATKACVVLLDPRDVTEAHLTEAEQVEQWGRSIGFEPELMYKLTAHVTVNMNEALDALALLRARLGA